MVHLGGDSRYAVADVTDITHPSTIGSFEFLDGPRFISASELSVVSYVDQNGLVRMGVSGSSAAIVAEGCRGIIAFDSNADGTSAAYVTDLEDEPGSQLHVIRGGKNQVVSMMPTVPWGVDCGSPCEDYVDSRLLYSPDGAYLSLVQAWGGPLLRIWTADGRLLKSIDSSVTGATSGAPTMSVWSGATLFYADTKASNPGTRARSPQCCLAFGGFGRTHRRPAN